MTRKITGPQDCTPQFRTLKYDDERLRFFTAEEVGQIIESILGIVERNYQVKPTHPDPVEPEGILFYHWLNKANELQGKPNDT